MRLTGRSAVGPWIVPRGLVAALLLAGFAAIASPATAAASQCSTSNPPSYSVTVCFSEPLDSSLLAGDSAVSTSVSVSGINPGVQRVVFTLDGEPLLTDVEAPYDFELPTAKFADGTKTLAAEAHMRDGFAAAPASIGVTFSNGNIDPPTNTNSFTPHTPAGSHGRVVAVGDGAGGRSESAAVTSSIAGMNPDMFFYLGDVYAKGTSTEFFNWYGHGGSYYNAFYDITNPVIGNHEYENGVAPGYFDYWDNVPDYYSYDALGWHFIALNSDTRLNEYTPGTAQYDWLQQDLSASQAVCTMVYFHHPRFSIGPQGDTPSMQPIWQLLADNGVDAALTGHDHSYQRWQRLDGAGNPDPDGVMQFVVGSGGHGMQSFAGADPRVAAGIDTPGNEGSLRADLNPAGAEFAFVTKNGNVLDSKPLACSGAGPDTSAPTTPTQLAGVAASGTQVDLSWGSAQDDVAVVGYTIYRDGVAVATVDAPATSYSDQALDPNTTYDYQVDAYDAAGNHSPRTAVEQVSTPGAPSSYDFDTVADGYVNASNPSSKYGTASVLRVDGSPVMRSYLGFDVAGVPGTVEASTLRVWSNASSSVGFEVRAVPAGSWSEADLTYDNSPAPGALIATSGPLTAGQYTDIDLPGFVTGDGQYSIVLTALSDSGISLASRESGTPAQLEIGVTPQGNVAPTADDLSLDADQQVSTNWDPVVDDANGDTLSCSIGTPAAHGTASVAPDCSSGTYVSEAGYEGSDSFTYVADDGRATDDGLVDVTVNAPPSYGPNPVADAYVDGSNPSSNYGTATQLRTDASPEIRSYLRFDAPLQGPVTSATLRVHASSNLSAGFEVRAVSDNGWGEDTITFANAPQTGSLIAASGPVSAGSYVDVDVTGYVTGSGLHSFALTPLSNTNLRLDSRETATPPELVVTQDTSGNSPPTAGHVAIGTDEDTVGAWTPAVSDPDAGDVLSCSIVAQPASGNATVASDCSSGSYSPDPDTNGADTFSYEVSDGSLTDQGTVDVTVAVVNDAPAAGDVDTGTARDLPITIELTAVDPDQDCPLSFAIDTGPSAGAVGPISNLQCTGGTATADVTYTPDSGVTGIDSFTYVASDPGSASSAPATVSVDVGEPQSSFSFAPEADAYVDGSKASSNYGNSTQLRTDASPEIRSYLRFDAPLQGPVTSATLRVHASSNLSAGFEVRAVSDNGWGEDTITFANAPQTGSLLAASGPVSAGSYVDVDVTGYVTGSGLYSFALTPLSNTNLRLDSRENATPPELVVEG